MTKILFDKEFSDDMFNVVELGKHLLQRKDIILFGNTGRIHEHVYDPEMSYKIASDIQQIFWFRNQVMHLVFEWTPSPEQASLIDKSPMATIMKYDLFAIKAMGLNRLTSI